MSLLQEVSDLNSRGIKASRAREQLSTHLDKGERDSEQTESIMSVSGPALQFVLSSGGCQYDLLTTACKNKTEETRASEQSQTSEEEE